MAAHRRSATTPPFGDMPPRPPAVWRSNFSGVRGAGARQPGTAVKGHAPPGTAASRRARPAISRATLGSENPQVGPEAPRAHRRLAEAAGEAIYQVQLIWGTDGEKPKDQPLKDIDPKLQERLKGVFKWKNYYEVSRRAVSLPKEAGQKPYPTHTAHLPNTRNK